MVRWSYKCGLSLRNRPSIHSLDAFQNSNPVLLRLILLVGFLPAPTGITSSNSNTALNMYGSAILTGALLAAVSVAAPTSLRTRESNNTANNLDLIHNVELAPTAADRINMLNSDTDFIYNFLAPPPGTVTTGLGGHTVKSDRKSFPALIGTGVSMTLGFIGPCGFNTPHVHPRGSEINVIVEGRLGTMYVKQSDIGS